MVSFHVAFISSVLSIPQSVNSGNEVIKFMFISPETIISLLFLLITFHVGISIHEMGHYLKAVKINALNDSLLPEAQKKLRQSPGKRAIWYLEMFFKIPYGRFNGVTKTGLDYHPDAPYNLAVAASGPKASRNLALFALPIAIISITIGFYFNAHLITYLGRLLLGIGAVGSLDFLLADPGKYREYVEREAKATKAKSTTERSLSLTAIGTAKWSTNVKNVTDKMIYTNMQKAILPNGSEMRVPWEFRNCGMGGRHTEKEFPESNISLQESMFVPLSPTNYEDAQEMTLTLQNRLKEIIENAEGCTVKGIGTEGGIVAYIKKEEGDMLPVERLWRMQKQAILDCGYVPGTDVAMAIDPAASELEHAYREEKGLASIECVGMYLAWRDKDKKVLTRDDLLEVYKKAIENDIPIISIEDGFAEDDDEGWKLLMDELGDKIHVIGDDYITTKDSTIEEKAEKRLINSALIKFNQIGTISEGILAILTAKGKGTQTVISHRSKSPIDDFEAHVALAANSLGLKVGGGSNSERLYKYESVVKIIKDINKKITQVNGGRVMADDLKDDTANQFINSLHITNIIAREAATNAGLPTVAVEVKVGLNGNRRYQELFTFEGSTPLGTSYGTDEAIHLVDSVIPAGAKIAMKYPELFEIKKLDKSYRFRKDVTDEMVAKKKDKSLLKLWKRKKRYNGKGCMNAVDNVTNIISKEFVGKRISELGGIIDIDRKLLALELDLAIKRGILPANASTQDQIRIMQRKCNLGMNATLSTSLAFARLMGAVQGMKLWEVLRDEMNKTMSKTIVTYGNNGLYDSLRNKCISHSVKKAKFEKVFCTDNGFNVLDGVGHVVLTKSEKSSIVEQIARNIELVKAVSNKEKEDQWQIINKELSFEELEMGLQIIDETRKDVIKLYELLREQLPVYNINGE